MVVTETITVHALGKKIRRGIYRDFPTLYSGPFFTRVAVPFHVKRVARNGQQEPFHLESISRGIRLYIGKEDRLLDRGQHTYQIEYETDRQLGYFENHDELYWNVTGTEWGFPIQQASAAVILPRGVPGSEIDVEGYTGPEHSKEQNYRSSVDATSGEVRFSTTESLGPGEGLTIVVSFPKGYLRQPTGEQKWARFREANPELLMAAISMAALLLYYLLAWVLVGKDPEEGAIFPQASPPMGVPPACVRYLNRMGFDRKCFTVALIDMAVKGHLRIDETGGTYELVRLEGAGKDLSRGEKAIARHLLSSGRIRLSQSNRKKLKKAIKALKTVLRTQYEGTHFQANRRWLIPGIILSFLSLGSIPLLGGGEIAAVGFMTLWLTIWTFGVCWLVLGAVGLASGFQPEQWICGRRPPARGLSPDPLRATFPGSRGPRFLDAGTCFVIVDHSSAAAAAAGGGRQSSLLRVAQAPHRNGPEADGPDRRVSEVSLQLEGGGEAHR